MTDQRDQRPWPAWLEPLRPGEAARDRIRGRVWERAEPLLAEARENGWWSATARWSPVLAPAAAAAAFFFAWMAFGSMPGTEAPSSLGPEELVRSGAEQTPPEMLTSGEAPDVEQVLTAALQPSGR